MKELTFHVAVSVSFFSSFSFLSPPLSSLTLPSLPPSIPPPFLFPSFLPLLPLSDFQGCLKFWLQVQQVVKS